MNVQDLKPKNVFDYFIKISSIPHGSGNTQGLVDYCLEFSKEHNLEASTDNAGNVLIKKNGTPGYEDHEPVVLQGHLDMVCEKVSDCNIDMATQPIELMTDGEWLWAKGTTLGGDDGIALAFIFALLADNEVKHPPIEALFTTDEEVGLIGAHGLDVSNIKGRKLINIDSEAEGVLTVSCAGAARIICNMPVAQLKLSSDEYCAFEVKVSGLLGGHSGIDINAHRRNSGKVLIELLDWIFHKVRISICDFKCGGRLNVIPSSATAVFCCSRDKKALTQTIITDFVRLMKHECMSTEPGINITFNETEVPEIGSSPAGTRQLVFALMECPHGVYGMSPDIEGLVQTSINLGNVSYSNGSLDLGFMARSNNDYGKRVLIRKLSLLTEQLQGMMSVEGDYPAWEYRIDSPLRDTMVQAYADFYGDVPKVTAIHAGLECGIIGEKIPGMDMVSVGPTMLNVHTPNEKLNIASCERSYNYLLRVLELL